MLLSATRLRCILLQEEPECNWLPEMSVLCYSNKVIISLLAHYYTVVTSIGTLERWCRQLHLIRSKSPDLEELARIGQSDIVAVDRCKDTHGSMVVTPSCGTEGVCCITGCIKIGHQVISLTYLHKGFSRGYRSCGSILTWKQIWISTFQHYSHNCVSSLISVFKPDSQNDQWYWKKSVYFFSGPNT